MHRLTAILALLLAPVAAMADDPSETQSDDAGDSAWRRTDPAGDGPLNPDQVCPDYRSLTFSKWSCPSPATDPFAGSASASGTHLFRIDLVIKGLVNPPGVLYDPYNPLSPFRYGPSPLIAFVEINVDRQTPGNGRDSGGDLSPEAGAHYLANATRFGGLPSTSIASRAVTRPGEYDSDFFTPPQLERSGAEFVFKLCGCEPFSILSTSVPDDTVFSEGDTWEIRGRFFERTSGFNGISLMTCPPQRYTPLVTVRFSHNMSSDTTTVSMVYATDQTGAAMLAGLASDPPINSEVGCDGDEGSVHEALSDVVVGATIADGFGWGTVELPTRVVSEPWANRGPLAEFLDPTDWRAFVLIGTTYSRSITVPSADGAEFVWTDAGGVHSGDVNGDGQVNVMDRTSLQSFISANDLIDGVMNGRVPTDGFSVEFFLQDLNYDGFVDCTDMADLGGSGCCPADWNGEDGLTLQDLFDFLEAWFGGQADFNTDGQTSIQDIFDFLTAYFLGCS